MVRSYKNTEVHGHRGCRGYLPENTIPAFLRAIDLGVDAIELDVVITGDGQVLVSHEAWFSAEFCLKPDGSLIAPEDETLHNIFKLPYETIRRFDCGSKYHPRFLDQERLVVSKPLLVDVIDAVETYIVDRKQFPVNYNIEIKSFPAGDNLFHPSPSVFANLLMDVVLSRGIISRTMIQSFDVRPLQEIYAKYKIIRLGLLVEDQVLAKEHLKKLGFLPFAYNPHHSLLTPKLAAYLKNINISIYAWTVNTLEDAQNCINLEVDGIITDYPDLIKNIL